MLCCAVCFEMPLDSGFKMIKIAVMPTNWEGVNLLRYSEYSNPNIFVFFDAIISALTVAFLHEKLSAVCDWLIKLKCRRQAAQ